MTSSASSPSAPRPPVELHLPDLPQVPMAIGGTARLEPSRAPITWTQRLGRIGADYFPLLLMVALALATWWLVKIAPQPDAPASVSAPLHVPDYELERFILQRYDAQGQPVAWIEGRQLRHYPDDDTLEIDAVVVSATGPDGHLTRATARQAVSNGDGSLVRLQGQARVQTQPANAAAGDEPVVIEGEQLVFKVRERHVSTGQTVQVRQGRNAFSAAALDYDAPASQLTLHGPLRAVFTPATAR